MAGQGPAGRFMPRTVSPALSSRQGFFREFGYGCFMNEHDPLEPTVAMPRVESPWPGAAPQPIPPQPIPPQPVTREAMLPPLTAAGARGAYVFGNPITYALRRFLAFVLDFVVVSGVSTMLLYGLIALNPLTGLPNNSEGGFDATVGMGVAI